MLILVAGITGNIGQKLMNCLLERGHRLRGLARNPDKLNDGKAARLEGFVKVENYYDIQAIDKACEGVNAIICVYAPVPELQLEGQLILLRAAERAGIRRFITASWNADWRNMSLGQHETYDPYICFRRQVELTSTIKPIYIFTGALLEVIFSKEGRVSFRPEYNGVWSPERKEMHVYGTGDELYYFTSEQDCANFTAAIIERDDVEGQQYWSVCSGALSLPDIAKVYGEVRGCEVSVLRKGSIEDLRRIAFSARAAGDPNASWMYIGWFYQLYNIDGTWSLKDLDNQKLGVRATDLKSFLEGNPEL